MHGHQCLKVCLTFIIITRKYKLMFEFKNEESKDGKKGSFYDSFSTVNGQDNYSAQKPWLATLFHSHMLEIHVPVDMLSKYQKLKSFLLLHKHSLNFL